MFFVRLFEFIFVLLLPTFLWASTIFYPGTFDPFHRMHEREVLEILAINPKDSVTILPIQHSYYHKTVAGTKIVRPQLFDFNTKMEIIENLFASNARVKISAQLQHIEHNVFEELSKVLASQPSSKIMVGVDVIELWGKIDGFSDFFNNNNFIISLDPSTPELNDVLKNKFSKYTNVEFITPNAKPIRSFVVNQNILRHSDMIEEYLAQPTLAYLEQNNRHFENLQSEYIHKLKKYRRAKVEFELLPLLEKNGLDPDIVKLIRESDELKSIMGELNGKTAHNISHVSKDIYEKLPPSTKTSLSKNFFSDFFKLCMQDEIASYTKELYTSSLLEKSYAEFLAQQPVKQGVNKLLSRLQNLSWKLIWNGYKRVRAIGKSLGLKSASVYSFQDEYLPLAEQTHIKGKVIVYRGVAPSPQLETYMKSFEKDGFLSKIALEERLQGKTISESIKVSENFLNQRGYKNALINHIIGDWVSQTPLISTSFDKEIAVRSAGVGGVVYTMEVDLNSGYIANDLGFWHKTPWEKIGNPNARLHEFAIKHHIPASDIIGIEKVTAMPAAPLKGSIQASLRMLKTVPWYVRNCSLFLKKQ